MSQTNESNNKIARISDLKGLGPKSEQMLAQVNIYTVDEFMQNDPIEIYAQLKRTLPEVSLNALYAMIGAQKDIHWLEVRKNQKEEILIKLDDKGIAPKR
ncbi:TfoX/Sxy family DNA transformation protein [Aliikangiella maris]|uniref:TfoX/Sxy family DNA transformation protein n=2 Tax=Aliikangiella maris TaxID=3162458 RepID=A0ABV2BTP4_9GAMM